MTGDKEKVRYTRVLLKLSGEALAGEKSFGISTDILSRIANEIKDVSELGVEIAIVIGGGNIFCGAGYRARKARASRWPT